MQPPPVLSCGLIPSLPVGIVHGHRRQRDRSDGTHLGFAEFADRSDPMHHTFDGSVVGDRRPSAHGTPPVEVGLQLSASVIDRDGIPVDGHDDGEDG